MADIVRELNDEIRAIMADIAAHRDAKMDKYRLPPDWSKPMGKQSIQTLALAVDELNARLERIEALVGGLGKLQ